MDNVSKFLSTLIAATLVIWFAISISFFSQHVQAEKLQYFTLAEFKDRITGEVKMNHDFLLKLDELRERCGFPIYIVSGYRSPDHPVEKIKYRPGQHTNGVAADVRALSGVYRYIIMKHAIDLGFTGIGVYPTHIHLDTRKSKTVLWVL